MERGILIWKTYRDTDCSMRGGYTFSNVKRIKYDIIHRKPEGYLRLFFTRRHVVHRKIKKYCKIYC